MVIGPQARNLVAGPRVGDEDDWLNIILCSVGPEKFSLAAIGVAGEGKMRSEIEVPGLRSAATGCAV